MQAERKAKTEAIAPVKRAVASEKQATAAIAEAIASEKRATAAAAEATARLRQVSLLAIYGWAGASDPAQYQNAIKADDEIQQMMASSTDAPHQRGKGVTMQIWAKDTQGKRLVMPS